MGDVFTVLTQYLDNPDTDATVSFCLSLLPET